METSLPSPPEYNKWERKVKTDNMSLTPGVPGKQLLKQPTPLPPSKSNKNMVASYSYNPAVSSVPPPSLLLQFIFLSPTEKEAESNNLYPSFHLVSIDVVLRMT